MKKVLYKLEDLLKFRHNMHQHAEIGFQEVQTQKNIISFLKKLGINEKDIKKCAKTGLFVDLYGKSKIELPNSKLIIFRADIDALETYEGNPDLPYRCKSKAAHLCGHDGHTTCLLGFASKYLEKIEEIPKNLGIRLLFQPCEEGTKNSRGGAIEMIEEGIMKDVDEVYGFHNLPTDPVGFAYIKSGPVMAEVVVINIKIFGKGGHGSEPSKCIDPIQPAIDIYNFTRGYILAKIAEDVKRNFRLSLTHIEAGSTSNVIPDTAFIEGTFRSFDEKFSKEFISEFSAKINELCTNAHCTHETKIFSLYPPVVNTEKETESILKIGKEFFGENKVTDVKLPLYCSEDFSFYLKEKPGCFFFLGSARTENDGYLHTQNFNFNDDLIPVAADFWIKVAEERLGFDKTIFGVKNLTDVNDGSEKLSPKENETKTIEEEEGEYKVKVKTASKKIKKKK